MRRAFEGQRALVWVVGIWGFALAFALSTSARASRKWQTAGEPLWGTDAPTSGGKKRPRLIGLTGGIGSGKSTAVKAFVEAGAYVIDADKIAREVVAPGELGLKQIVETFGPEVLQGDGTLDRGKLGKLVFSNEDARRKLNAIVHPQIGRAISRRIDEAGAQGIPVVIVDVPLLVETGMHEHVDRVVVVKSRRKDQIARVMARDGISEDQAKARIRSQAPMYKKLAVADYVLDNPQGPQGPQGSQGAERLRKSVFKLWQQLEHGW